MILIKGIASIGAAMLIGLSASSAGAGYVVDLTQQGSNVVATGTGPIDLTGLTFNVSSLQSITIVPGLGVITTGGTATADLYTGITGPANFGSGAGAFASSGSGDVVGVGSFLHELAVPAGYVSDDPLSDTATYLSQTFASLGATPGTYKWTWGDGANQNFTLVIGTVVPEPSTWAMMLIGFAGLGLMGYQSAGRRRRTTATLRLAIGGAKSGR
jgi:PEP-CTERM motif